MAGSWLRELNGERCKGRVVEGAKRRHPRLDLVRLEDRCTPATFTVNTTDDTPDANLNDGLALDANNHTSLRAAIEQATELGGATVHDIVFDSTVFDPSKGPYTINLSYHANPNATTADQLLLGANIQITGPGQSVLTVQPSVNTGDHGIFFVGDGTNCTLAGMTISGGGTASTTYGGGIYSLGTLLVSSCTLTRNLATNGGGAIANMGGKTLTVLDSLIWGNWASGGGAQSDGGGIFNTNQGTVQVQSSTIRGNSASIDGGGIANINGTVTITGSTVSDNVANRNGGGMYNGFQATVNGGSVFSGNSAVNEGGGILSDLNAALSLDGVTIDSNRAPAGNGVYWVTGSIYNEVNVTWGGGNTAQEGP